MKARFRLKSGVIILFIIFIVAIIGSCKDETITESILDAGQLLAGRIDGTWTDPSNIITPENVPAAVFGDMRLVFTTDSEGYPAKFIAKDCPIVFSSSASAWSVATGTSDSIKVVLTDVEPVDELTMAVSSTSLTISFYMGWENTETGDTGKGNFSVTLTRN